MAGSYSIYLPSGYMLTLTTDAISYGSAYYIGEPGNRLSDITDVPVASTVEIGPFNEGRAYNIVSTVGEIQRNIEFSGNYTKQDSTQPYDYYVYVDNMDDLPVPVNGVITLDGDKAYKFTQAVDLNGCRLVGGSNTAILGTSSETASITSTGLGVGVPLFTTTGTTPIQNISFKDVDTCFDIDGATGNEALDWIAFNILNCPNIGTIKNVSNWILVNSAFLSSSGLVFDGTIGTVGISGSILTGDGEATDMISIASTATITRRFRIIYTAFVAFGSNTGINVSTSATIPTESYILDSVNFSGGAAYVSGVTNTDNKAKFIECVGVINTSNLSSYHMSNNTTATTISATGTPVKVAGTTIEGDVTQRFTHADNRLTFDGAITRDFAVTAVATLNSGNNNQIGLYIAKNGSTLNDSEMYTTTNSAGRSESIAIQTILSLSNGDYIEVFAENNTSTTDITVSYLNVIVRAIN